MEWREGVASWLRLSPFAFLRLYKYGIHLTPRLAEGARHAVRFTSAVVVGWLRRLVEFGCPDRMRTTSALQDTLQIVVGQAQGWVFPKNSHQQGDARSKSASRSRVSSAAAASAS